MDSNKKIRGLTYENTKKNNKSKQEKNKFKFKAVEYLYPHQFFLRVGT